MFRHLIATVTIATAGLSLPLIAADTAPTREAYGPLYRNDGKLLLPSDYREWVYLSSGLGMSYNPKPSTSDDPTFDNVFVNPAAYKVFQQTGRWPEQTMLVLEQRNSSAKGSINQHGHYQSGPVTGLEVHLKDSSRFAGGWAFFDVDGGDIGTRIPTTAACYACHQSHGAVDTTFVQFYPSLLPIARSRATLSASFVQESAAELSKSN